MSITYNYRTGTITATSFVGALTGNADTATSAAGWTTGRTITLSGDVSGTSPSWDGTGNLAFTGTVVANDSHTHDANNLTGTTLASGVVTSSLTTVGTIGTGVWQGTDLDATRVADGNLGSGVLPYATVDTAASAYKIPFLNTTGVASGNFGLLHDTTATFTYNPSTNTVTAATFSGALTGNASTATALATGRTIGMTGDVVWTSASFDGTGNVTGTSTIQAGAVDVAMLANGTDGELITWSAAGAPTTVAVGTATHVLTSNGIGAAPTFQAPAGGGNVSNTGTPVNNQIAVWTDATTVEGDPAFTFDATTNTLSIFDTTNAESLQIATSLTEATINAQSGNTIALQQGGADILTLASGTSTFTSGVTLSGTADDLNMPTDGNIIWPLGEIYATSNDFIIGAKGSSTGNDFFLQTNRSGTAKDGIIIRNNAEVEMYYNDTLKFQTADETATDGGTGAAVVDGLGTMQPVGFNTIPVYEIDVADTFDLAHNGMMWHKDSGAAVTFTCNNDTTIPVGASYLVHNDDTEDLTIAEGTATIEFLAPGAAPVGGNVTVEQGGIVTVYKYTDAIFWVWGAKAAATAANITVADESADTTCFPVFVTAATGDLPAKTGSNLAFNSSTGALTATSFSGSGASLTSLTAANISTGSLASGVNHYFSVNSTNAAFKVPFLGTTGTTAGNYGMSHETTATFTYNPSSNTLVAGTFSGALSGNATTATSAAGWTTGRTITLSGDVSGTSPSWDGTGNLAFTGTVVANDSHTHTFDNLTSKASGTGFYATSGQFQAADGLCGTYDDAASASWGGPIWGMDDGFTGPTGGANALATGCYGIRWNRASSTQAHADIGEGLYVYQNGVLEGGIGSAGIYSAGTLDVVGLASFEGGAYLGDSDVLQFGVGDEASMYSNGTDFYTDLRSGGDWRLRHITENMILGIANAQVELYHNGGLEFRTQQHEAASVTSGAEVYDHAGTLRDVGFNHVKEVAATTVSIELSNLHAGTIIRRTGTSTIDIDMAASTTEFPVGSMCTVINHGTSGTFTIDNDLETMYVLDGSGTVTASTGFALAIGGVVTIWRQAASVYYVWGAGIP